MKITTKTPDELTTDLTKLKDAFRAKKALDDTIREWTVPLCTELLGPDNGGGWIGSEVKPVWDGDRLASIVVERILFDERNPPSTTDRITIDLPQEF